MKTQETCSKEDDNEIYSFFYAINKLRGRNATEGTYNIYRKRINQTDRYLDPNKLTLWEDISLKATA